jgi:putative ABC transport system permease protein
MNKNISFVWSEWSESFLMAVAAIKANKLRSALTLLGIVVGVFSIIAVTTAMRVMQDSIESRLNSLGSNTFEITKFPVFHAGGPGWWVKYWNRKDLTYEDVVKLKSRANLASSVGAMADKDGLIATHSQQTTNPNVDFQGVTPDMFSAQNKPIGEGRAITQSDIDISSLVCVIDPVMARTLFPHSDPLGHDVKIDGIGYRIVGLIKDQGNVLGGGNPYMMVPITTFFARYGKQRSLDIYVQALSQQDFSTCEEQVQGILRAIRSVPPGKPDDFEMISNAALIDQFNHITFYIRVGAIVVSAIALLAAGVGIMNIMLVGVTERTREIGVRKSIGATKRNILTQFLLEAIVLCEVGGIVGVLAGLLGGNLAALAMHMKAAFPLDWAVIGLIVCSLVGVIFGVYPAYKAASVDPIESLRYE